MVILDIALMALISAAIIGLLVWAIFTQHRHPGYEDVGVPRRLRVSIKLAPVEARLPSIRPIKPPAATEL